MASDEVIVQAGAFRWPGVAVCLVGRKCTRFVGVGIQRQLPCILLITHCKGVDDF